MILPKAVNQKSFGEAIWSAGNFHVFHSRSVERLLWRHE
jgi:hypothetical protein